jgi:hypothetical protein
MNKRHADLADFVRIGRHVRVTATVRWNYGDPDYTEVETMAGPVMRITEPGYEDPPGFSINVPSHFKEDYHNATILIAYRDVITLTGAS